ncbi:dehydrogenase/reductase SDR family member 7 [Mus pahari]|uniref:dehydrogenase/reductase SDR family member 7 n=1 Tax=Mus pahari TaxID=10093 RepID=UPI000A314472|nr:dehydrogenase/reductase SDR family member 7 [Mus pahari]
MSWELLLWLLALCALILPLVQLLRFLRADADLTLLWAEWQGRRPEWELTDMVVWITGASSGIGEELAFQLCKLGVSLVLSARRVQELERVKRRCLGRNCLKDCMFFLIYLLGIDILVNNSGRSQRSLVLETSLDVFKELINLNYIGTVSLTKCVLPHMIERKQGKIVTVNSIAGIASVSLSSGYCASKHALRGFFNALLSELGQYPGITLCNIYPGPVQSDIVKNALTEEVNKSMRNNIDQSYKMPTSRCVRLMLIAMANDLKEVWISDHPVLLGAYIWQYMPTWASWLNCKLGKKRIQNFKNNLDPDLPYKFLKAKKD